MSNCNYKGRKSVENFRRARQYKSGLLGVYTYTVYDGVPNYKEMICNFLKSQRYKRGDMNVEYKKHSRVYNVFIDVKGKI